MDFIKHYRPYSVDSSSLYSGQRYGNLQYYVGAGNLKSINRVQLNRKPPSEVISALYKTGFEHKEIALLAYQDAWEGGASPYYGKSYRGLAAYMTVTNHVKRAIEVEQNLGTRIYLALGGESQINNVFDSLNQLQTKKLL
jgi:hypothetical protein